MKKILLSVSLIIGLTVAALASELSFSGVSPVSGAYEWGVAGGFPVTDGELDTSNLELEVLYRKYIEESLDWGFSLSPVTASPDFVFDLKCRLLKESSVIPNIVLGVNMVKLGVDTSNGTSIQTSFLDTGRIGFSKTFQSYEFAGEPDRGQTVTTIKKTEFYVGTYIVDQQIDSTNIYFGFKSGSLNFMVEAGDGGISFIGIAFLMSE